ADVDGEGEVVVGGSEEGRSQVVPGDVRADPLHDGEGGGGARARRGEVALVARQVESPQVAVGHTEVAERQLFAAAVLDLTTDRQGLRITLARPLVLTQA